MVLVLHAVMGAGDRAGRATALRNSGVRPVSRLTVRTRWEERNAKLSRVAVVLALFLVLLAGALLVTCRAVINSMLQAPIDPRVANKVGDIVFTLPDGAFCRHLSFNNATAELMESSAAPCPEAKPRGRSRIPNRATLLGAHARVYRCIYFVAPAAPAKVVPSPRRQHTAFANPVSPFVTHALG